MPRTGTKHRVLIVDDHEIVRDGLAQLINRQTDLAVCGQAADVRAARVAVEIEHPDIVLLDLMIGHGDGLELLRCFRAEHPDVRILVVSMHDEKSFAERALRAGASGYVTKAQPSQEILVAIRTVMDGDIYLSRKFASLLVRKGLNSSRSKRVAGETIAKLSDRELHVFQLIGSGLSSREIAAEMGLSVKTVECYREAIKTKAGYRNSAELVGAAKAWVETSGEP